MTGDPQTILVTGAMGQIGKRVTGILLDRGAAVVALDLRTDATVNVASGLAQQAARTDRFAPVSVDLTDPHAVHALVAERRPDAIVHLAAVVSPVCYRDPDLARRVNVLGTANLVSAAARLAVPPFFVEAS